MNIIEQIINNPQGGPYEWVQVLLMAIEMGNRPITDDERVWLGKGKTFTGRVTVTHSGDGPHSRPPDYFIRHICCRLLGEPFNED